VDQKKIENEYLLPEDARKLMAYQIFNDRAHKIGKRLMTGSGIIMAVRIIGKTIIMLLTLGKKRLNFDFLKRSLLRI
jgi:hypothetical protein